MAVEEPNLAPVIAEIEVTAPAPNNSGDGQVSTTLPTTATGIIANTSIDVSNNDLSHSCDFALTLQKNNALKRYLRSAADEARQAVRAILQYLGFSDETGLISIAVSKLKWLAASLRYIQQNIIKPIQDFENYVIAYAQKIASMITWIKSLPAQILGFLKGCLASLQQLVGSIFSDILQSDTSADSNLLSALKETTSAASSLLSSTIQTVATAQALPTAVVSTILSTPSQSTLNQANTTISNFVSSYTSPSPSINKSSP